MGILYHINIYILPKEFKRSQKLLIITIYFELYYSTHCTYFGNNFYSIFISNFSLVVWVCLYSLCAWMIWYVSHAKDTILKIPAT